jgi:iron complex transport system substrate-binding protein
VSPVRVRPVTAILTTIAGLLLLAACSGKRGQPGPTGVPQRIVSLSPSITETLFALGCGDRVVAVTDFCTYPAEVRGLPRVGGYVNPNYEQLLALKPDLVLLRREHAPVVSFLQANGMAFVQVDNDDIQAILDSFRRIGAACGVGARGDSLARAVQAELQPVRSASRAPSVLLCVGRSDMGSGRIAGVFAAGKRTYYRELLEAAGAHNALDGSTVAYPSLAIEGVLRLAPEIIVDLVASARALDTARVRADWAVLSGVPAVEHGMVFCLTESYVTIPGPRIGLLLRDLRAIVARWQAMQKASGARPATAGE